jgi:hypothetical protein
MTVLSVKLIGTEGIDLKEAETNHGEGNNPSPFSFMARAVYCPLWDRSEISRHLSWHAQTPPGWEPAARHDHP